MHAPHVVLGGLGVGGRWCTWCRPPRAGSEWRRWWRARGGLGGSRGAVHRATEGVADGGDDVLDLREGGLLERGGVGHGDVGAGDAFDGRVEVIEGVGLHDNGADLRPDAALRPAFFDGDDAVRFLGRVDDGLAVEGPEGAEVEHFAGDALGGEDVGGLHAEADHLGEGHEGDVRALALDLGLADVEDVVLALGLVAERKGDAVEEFVLEEDDGVRVADGGLEETLGVLGVPGRDDLEARALREPRRVALRVLGRGPGGRAVGSSEDHGHGHVAVGHVGLLGRRVDDLVDGLHGEVERHELADGSEVLVGGTDRDAREPHLRDGRVEDALLAVLLEEALGHLVRALVLRHLLAEDEDLLVALHLFVHGHVQRFANRHVDGRHASRQASLYPAAAAEAAARRPSDP
mmetsp:Transcript_1363/g.3497  ORF Transcript_1363/g.3497 Transcript_1363/m.3497 type:complete len:405 (-) Transcript_1363:77-1291(-)